VGSRACSRMKIRVVVPMALFVGVLSFSMGLNAQQPAAQPATAAAQPATAAGQPTTAAAAQPTTAAAQKTQSAAQQPTAKPPVAANANSNKPAQATAPPPPTLPPTPPPVPPQPPFPNIPEARKLWSAEPAKESPMLPRSESDALRLTSAAIVGDRADVVFESERMSSIGGRPVRKFRMLSMDLKTGKEKGKRDLTGSARPTFLATDDAHLILWQGTATRLNPDLSESGEHFGDSTQTSGRRELLISPDGGTLAWARNGTTQFLDAHTLQPSRIHVQSPEPGTVGKRFLLSTALQRGNQFPGETTFITLYGGYSPLVIYHGSCAGHPVFLDEQRFLTVACNKVTIYDLSGRVLKELPTGAAYGAFAGVSRDGTRFAIESSDYPVNDPSWSASEMFTIYDAQSFAPVATVVPDSLPSARSWAAFAQDGKSFLVGSPRKASLYQIP